MRTITLSLEKQRRNIVFSLKTLTGISILFVIIYFILQKLQQDFAYSASWNMTILSILIALGILVISFFCWGAEGVEGMVFSLSKNDNSNNEKSSESFAIFFLNPACLSALILSAFAFFENLFCNFNVLIFLLSGIITLFTGIAMFFQINEVVGKDWCSFGGRQHPLPEKEIYFIILFLEVIAILSFCFWL